MSNTAVNVLDSFGNVHNFNQEGVRFYQNGENLRVYSHKHGTIAEFYKAAAVSYSNPPERKD